MRSPVPRGQKKKREESPSLIISLAPSTGKLNVPGKTKGPNYMLQRAQKRVNLELRGNEVLTCVEGSRELSPKRKDRKS